MKIQILVSVILMKIPVLVSVIFLEADWIPGPFWCGGSRSCFGHPNEDSSSCFSHPNKDLCSFFSHPNGDSGAFLATGHRGKREDVCIIITLKKGNGWK